MTPRAAAMLGPITRSTKIVEIGPNHAPLLRKSDGWNVRSIDHASREDLVAKNAHDPSVDTSLIETVDYVWVRGSLADAVPVAEHGSFDGFVASHVVEHTPDLIAFLDAARVLLKPSGFVGLAVPDRRYCFDYFQPMTSTGAVIEAHLGRQSRHRPGTIYDHHAYMITADRAGAWGQHPITDLELVHEMPVAREMMEKALADAEAYIDSHNWRFTPSSFELVMLELAWLGMTDWKVDHITPAQGCEFIVRMHGGGAAWARSFWPKDLQKLRLKLLRASMMEQREQIDWLLAGEAAGHR